MLTYFKLLLLFSLFFNSNVLSLILREIAEHSTRPHYSIGKRASKDHIHEVIFAIKQNNLDEVEKILYEVSTPESPSYGNHLSFDEIGRIVVNREATFSVINWLKANGADINYQSYYGEYVTASASIELWEILFDTSFHEYHPVESFNKHNSYKTVVRAMSYSLPEEIDPHIHAVFRLVNLPPPISSKPSLIKLSPEESKQLRQKGEEAKVSSDSGNLNTYVYPANLYHAYSISGSGNGYSTQTIYGSLDQTFLPSDLASFQSDNSLPSNPIQYYIGPTPNSSTCYTTPDNCIEASLDVQYITSIGLDIPTTYFYDSGNDFDYINFITNVSNLANPTYVYSISYGSYEIFITLSEITTFNTEAMKLGLRGVTIMASSGDDGVTGFLFKSGTYPMKDCGYYASFPASSPYVTAVGGTMGGMELTGTKSAEIVCSVLTGAIITSGGGFSNQIAAPSFQHKAITSYTSKYKAKEPHFSTTYYYNQYYAPYNTSKRGYPDVSMAAHYYVIYVGGYEYLADGTSASSPVFAGLVSLVNSKRLAASKPTLGWLNPSIYSNYGGYANDIIAGNNSCTSSISYCCSIGFKAEVGWDPVTGFGSINYTKFLQYYESLSVTNYPTFTPTILPTSKSNTKSPTKSPTKTPTFLPTSQTTASPSLKPTLSPTTATPSLLPTIKPSSNPSLSPQLNTNLPSLAPSLSTHSPSGIPTCSLSSSAPSNFIFPTLTPSLYPQQSTNSPSIVVIPTCSPTSASSTITSAPSILPTINPTACPSLSSQLNTDSPSLLPSLSPLLPSITPTISFPPTPESTSLISISPTIAPSQFPHQISSSPSVTETISPSKSTFSPSLKPNKSTEKPSMVPTIGQTVVTASSSPTGINEISNSPTHSPSITAITINPTIQQIAIIPTIPPTKTILPTSIPTIKLSSKPSIKPSKFPTAQPTASKSAHDHCTYYVAQQITTSTTASDFLSNSYTIVSFETVIGQVFSSMTPSSIDVITAVDITISNRKLESIQSLRNLGSTSGILVNYTIGFDIYTDNVQTIDSLTTNVTDVCINSINTGIFNTYLSASPSAVINSMSSSVIPQVSQTPTVVYVSTSTSNSSSLLSKQTVIIISIVGSFILLMLVGASVLIYFRVLSKSITNNNIQNGNNVNVLSSGDIELYHNNNKDESIGNFTNPIQKSPTRKKSMNINDKKKLVNDI